MPDVCFRATAYHVCLLRYCVTRHTRVGIPSRRHAVVRVIIFRCFAAITLKMPPPLLRLRCFSLFSCHFSPHYFLRCQVYYAAIRYCLIYYLMLSFRRYFMLFAAFLSPLLFAID